MSGDSLSARRGWGARLAGWAERLDDGLILKLAFYAMAGGTLWVLVSDYRELHAQNPMDVGVREPGGDPVLPAVERPEIDPDNPAYRPREMVRTPSEQLAEPLSIELVAGGVLELSGTITPGAAALFAAEIEKRGDYIETVALNSPGGSVEDALTIGRAIRAQGLVTHVGEGALCASSCPLVLAGGLERVVAERAAVGIHQIYAEAGGSAIGSAQAMSDAQTITARITRYLDEMGIDPLVWVPALETPPNRLYYLTAAEVADYRLSTP